MLPAIRAIPFIRIFVPLAAGILLIEYISLSPLLLLGAAIVSAALALVLHRLGRKYATPFGAVLMLAILLLGAYRGSSYDEREAATFYTNTTDTARLYIADVAAPPVETEKRVKVRLTLRSAYLSDGTLQKASGSVMAYLPKSPEASRLRYADRVQVASVLQPVPPPANPHSFDYAQYLHYQNVHTQAFMRAGEWAYLGSGRGSPLQATAYRWQQAGLAAIQSQIPETRESAVASALILGNRTYLPEEVRTAYAETGAIHVLAVSGLHVGIVSGILLWLLQRTLPRYRLWSVIVKIALLLLAIWTFALVTGLSPSVLRAATMFSFIYVGQSLQYRVNTYNTLALSAVVLLIANPYLLFQVGFQLSYLAVFGIVYFQRRIVALWYPPYRALRYVWELTSVSLAAQLMVVPLSLFYFGQLPTYFWLSSLVAIPLAGFILPVGLALLGASLIGLPGVVLDGLGRMLYALLWLLNETIAWVQTLPVGLIKGIYISGLGMLMLYAILYAADRAIQLRRPQWIMTSLGLVVLLSFGSLWRTYETQQTRNVTIYSVGAGKTLASFRMGHEVVQLATDTLPTKAVYFASSGALLHSGSNTVATYGLDDSLSTNSDFPYRQVGRKVAFDGTTWIFADATPRTSADYWVIGSKCYPPDRDSLSCKQLILNAYLYPKQREAWESWAESRNVPTHDISRDGAFVRSF